MNIIKEETTNFAQISGRICSALEKSHQVEGEEFFEFKVAVDRLSKVADVVPVTVSERSIVGKTLKEGDLVKICGEYRSYNKLVSDKSRLILHVFAKEIELCDTLDEHLNEVKLTGFLCKSPVYRKTPFDREICDILLAVNRPNYHKTDYVPCILWGRNARFMAEQNVGCKVELSGRIQSREYSKTSPNGQTEVKTAYEVSCQRIAILSNMVKIESSTNNTDIAVN
ncbi:MAG: single-stranded DNA-binding protein [Clostridia bacterium]|nr:single-stranded DNA-binding protein [Clostridia bacterium]